MLEGCLQIFMGLATTHYWDWKLGAGKGPEVGVELEGKKKG
jgi:hypothetical protein